MPNKTDAPEYGRCVILKEWPEWEFSIHAADAQVERQGWALNYPFTFRINKKARAARFSSTSDLPYYETTLGSCTCHDFEKRKLPCKHIYRLALELGVIDIINRNSSEHVKDRLAAVRSSVNIDEHPEQVKRIEKARDVKCKPLSIDYENQTAVFCGSGKVPYETTVDTCTCRDYFVRRLPCKHIYRLRMELGLMGENAGKTKK